MLLTRTQITAGLLATGAVAFTATGVSAQNIALTNPGFESNDFQDPGVPAGTSLFLLATENATFEVPGWMQFGPLPDLESGIAFTGVFNNVSEMISPTTTFPEIGNSGVNPPEVTTDRLAFLGIDPVVGGTAGIYQETGTTFALGQTYTLSVDAAGSVRAAPGSDNPLTDPAKLTISIGYLDGSDAFVAVESLDITQFIDDMVDSPTEIKDRFDTLDNDPEFNLLRSFSVTAIDPLAGDASLIGKEIAVQIATVGVPGGSGFFSVDSVELTQVPEPTSLALLGLGGLLAFRRRR